MGIQFSKPQLQRKKSLSTFGRSSQRSLFQKCKAKLRSIEKRLETGANHDEIKNELDVIEKELMNVSSAVKEKNKDKYEEIVEVFFELKNKVFDEPVEITEVSVAENQTEAVAKIEDDDDVEVEVRKPIELYERPSSPSIKFGVQVMPIVPRVSQEMLKRNTIPHSETAKSEFQEIRAMSSNAKMVVHSSFTSRTEENGNVKEFTRVSIEERPFQFKSDLNQIDRIRTVIDELEATLKYFHGVKGDEDYQNLHQKLVQNLAKLENVESQDNPVIKQEKKILMQRIQELLKILERIAEPIKAVTNTYDADSDNSTGTAI